MAYNSLMVFTGNANPKLAADVAAQLNVDLGRANVGRFSDGEVSVELQEHVRGRDIFVLQSTCAPCNDNLMELLVIVDSLKRASAGRMELPETAPRRGGANAIRVVEKVAERELRREVEGIKRVAKVHASGDTSAWAAAVQEWYGEHFARLQDVLEIPADVARNYCALRERDVIANGVAVLESWSSNELASAALARDSRFMRRPPWPAGATWCASASSASGWPRSCSATPTRS